MARSEEIELPDIHETLLDLREVRGLDVKCCDHILVDPVLLLILGSSSLLVSLQIRKIPKHFINKVVNDRLRIRSSKNHRMICVDPPFEAY
jgi:hypothetical protein